MVRFTQIVYLVIVCPANSNFSALYSSIGAEIDSVLGNMEPVYERMISRCRTIGEKANMISKLIELFGIGCIIFDEIQLLDFEGQKESTFESLLTIVNKTKVAIMAVGTQDAYKKMSPNLRTSRRTGAFIEANQYCNDKRYFAAIVTNLMQYQWFDEYVKPDSSLIRALYDVTKGIIDQLISIYIYMQIDYIWADKKSEINADYVYKISDTYYPGIQKSLNDLDNPENEMKHQVMIEEGKANIQRILEKAKLEESKAMFLGNINSQDNQKKMSIKENAIRNIENTIKITGEVYNLSRIEKAVEHAMGVKKNEAADEEMITQNAYKWLKKNKSDKRVGGKKKAVMDEEHIAVRNLLLGE